MSIRQRYREVLHEVTSLRDMARVQAHLFSVDARDRWREIETALESAEQVTLREGEDAVEVASTRLKRAAELGQQLFLELMSDAEELKVFAHQLMAPNPKSCWPYDSLDQAAQIMWDHDCGCVPVVDDDGKVIAVITDRDVAMAGYLTGRRLAEVEVKQAMSRSLVTAHSDHTLAELLALMARHQVRRIPIVDSQERLMGMVALADIVRHVAATESTEAARSLIAALSGISSASRF